MSDKPKESPAPDAPATPAASASRKAAEVELVAIASFQHAGVDFHPARTIVQRGHPLKLPADRGRFPALTASALINAGVAVRAEKYQEVN